MPYEVTALASSLKEVPACNGNGCTLIGAILMGSGSFRFTEASDESMAPSDAISLLDSRVCAMDGGNDSAEGSARAADTEAAARALPP